jgi:hypothetical protein
MQRVYSGEMPPAMVGQTAEGGPIFETQPAAPRAAEREPLPREPLPAERRTGTKRDLGGPDFMRTTLLNKLRQQLETLPEGRDRAIVQQQYDDALAHPFERAEGETDINRIKAKSKPTKTKAEAEASVQERAKGRGERFKKGKDRGELNWFRVAEEENPIKLKVGDTFKDLDLETGKPGKKYKVIEKEKNGYMLQDEEGKQEWRPIGRYAQTIRNKIPKEQQ